MPAKGTFRPGERVPAKPFADWISKRLDTYRAGMPFGETPDMLGPMEQLASDLGWGATDSGARKLYRFKHLLTSRSRNGISKEGATDTFRRDTVEDALDHAGVPFEDVYPDLAVDVVLEPDVFCGRCREMVTPIGGVCPWCDRRLRVPGEREAA